MDRCFYRKYQLMEELGRGGFGVVSKGLALETKKEVAIKLEDRKGSRRHVLQNEIEAYRHLQGGPGIPKLYASGSTDSFAYMIMELLGHSLSKLLKDSDSRLSPISISTLAQQIITTLEFVHSRGYLHRDIKPQNFCMGLGDSEVVYLLDFGLATKFMDEKLGIHAPYREERTFLGTASFASLNAHMGVQQSRRDDLESLLLVLVYLLKGKLPWQGGKYKSKVDKQVQIRMQKLLISAEELCEGLPPVYSKAFTYIRSLGFEEKPDYDMLIRDLRKISQKVSVNLALAALPEDKRLKRSYKTHKRTLKKSTTVISTVDTGTAPRVTQERGTARVISCPPQPKSDLLSPVLGHHIRSRSVGILPEQPSGSSIPSESSQDAWMGEMSSTLEAPLLPINRRLLSLALRADSIDEV